MADIVSPTVRSRMMSGIRGKDTKPEILLRKALHAEGFRYRLHDRKLPGRPDIVLPRWKAVILVHGCFWHGHHCHLFRLPGTRTEFWRDKISGNRDRDDRNRQALLDQGWRVLEVWECAMRGSGRLPWETLLAETVSWIRSDRKLYSLQEEAIRLESSSGF
ncbi:very short patch repair endonuclease [Gluconobacter oxydans]|uniref:very short patch repair endonuclease n=1 Tax=Gluconobacter oxydans TaxID=442 RepID=UPI0039EA1840